MVSINGVTPYGANQYQWFEQIAAQSVNATSDSTASTSVTSLTNSTSSTSSTSADGTSSSGSLLDQIKSAITTALETAEQSGDTTNFQTVIKNAVDKTLQANGIDPSQLQQQSQSAGGGMMPPGFGPPPDATSSTGDSSTSSTSSGG